MKKWPNQSADSEEFKVYSLFTFKLILTNSMTILGFRTQGPKKSISPHSLICNLNFLHTLDSQISNIVVYIVTHLLPGLSTGLLELPHHNPKWSSFPAYSNHLSYHYKSKYRFELCQGVSYNFGYS